MDDALLVEGALFSAGKPLSVKELSEALDMGSYEVRGHIRKLTKLYKGRKTALEIARVGTKYCMQVKGGYQETARSFAPTEIPPELLKTLAFIAYQQPVKQSSLVKMMGSKIYDHVKELNKMKMIKRTSHGQTYELVTTGKFCEHFGIKGKDMDDIKRWLRERISVSGTFQGTLPGRRPEEGAAEGAEGDTKKEIPGSEAEGRSESEGEDEESAEEKCKTEEEGASESGEENCKTEEKEGSESEEEDEKSAEENCKTGDDTEEET